MQRISRLDQRIEFLRNKIARTSGDEKAKYKEMLREYLNERSLLIKEIKKIDRESRKSLIKIREKYVEPINAEFMRQRVIEKEKVRLIKDYDRIVKRVDNIIFTIENLITRIIEMVNDYVNMFQNMLIETPRYGDGVYLLKVM